MINFALLKSTAKSNWVVFIIAILLMYMYLMLSMFDLDNNDAMRQMMETMPEGIMVAFGYGGNPTDLLIFKDLPHDFNFLKATVYEDADEV